jgi:hypothetical protein
MRVVERLVEHSLIEFEPAQLAVDVQLGAVGPGAGRLGRFGSRSAAVQYQIAVFESHDEKGC